MSVDGVGQPRTKKPRQRSKMLAPKKLIKSPHAQKAMAELIGSGRAPHLLDDDIMEHNARLAGAVSAVLAGYVVSRDPSKMNSDEARSLADMLSALTQNEGPGLRKPKGKPS